MASIDDIEKLLDRKLITFRAQILRDIEEKWAKLVETNQKNIAANTASIEGINDEVEKVKASCEQQIRYLENELKQRDSDIDDIVNRSMRCNVIIKGVPEQENEDWDTTKSIATDYLSSLSNENTDTVFRKLDRAHRGGKKEKDKPRHIYANCIYSTDASFYVDLSVKQWVSSHNKGETKPTWRVEHQYSKSLTERRDKALLHRQELLKKKEYEQCRLAYPAKLLGKKDRKIKKWEFIKDF